MKHFFLACTILSAALLVGCGANHEYVFDPGEITSTSGTQDAGITLFVNWVKKKPNSIDTEIYIVNNYKHSISISGSAFQISYGGVKVSARNTSGYLQLAPGARAKQLLIFPLETQQGVGGLAKLTIDPIENASDGDKHGTKIEPATVGIPIKPSI